MSEPSEYGLIVSFPDESASFVHGWEAGELWRDMNREFGPIERTLHAENQEVVVRMCAALGWSVAFKPTQFPEWVEAILTRSSKPKLELVKS